VSSGESAQDAAGADAWRLWHFAPLLHAQRPGAFWCLVGEAQKYVPVSRERFQQVAVAAGGESGPDCLTWKLAAAVSVLDPDEVTAIYWRNSTAGQEAIVLRARFADVCEMGSLQCSFCA
jgi:hypothetical protein